MDFSLSEEQRLLQDSILKFIQNDYTFEAREKIIASEVGFSGDYWKLFAEQGWLGMFFAEKYGGFDASPTFLMVVMEAMGKGLVVEPFVPTVVMAGGLISLCGSEEQKAEYLPAIADGSKKGAFAFIEPQSRYNLFDVVTSARELDDGSWAITGYKGVVLGGPMADFFVVAARTDEHQRSSGGISLFIVPRDTEDLDIRDYPTIDGARASELNLKEVRVPAKARLGELCKGGGAMEQIIDHAILAVGSEAVGCMELLYKDTVEYCKTRVQFGQPIGKFQVLQHRMVDMFMEHEQAKSLMYMAAMRLEEGYGDVARKAASAFKVQVGKSGRCVGQGAVQLHGGMGMTEELRVSHYFKRLTAIEALFGNTGHHLKRFGQYDA